VGGMAENKVFGLKENILKFLSVLPLKNDQKIN
jgi:hypothetical protein